jgi:hypothetical protein
MTTQASWPRQFLQLHRPGEPLLMPNAWDVGSAVLLASLGFEALATTSGGFAASKGRLDGAMRRDEVLAYVASWRRPPRSAALGRPGELLRRRSRGCGAHHLARRSTPAWPDSRWRTSRATTRTPSTTSIWPRNGCEAAAEAAHDETRHIVVTARAENYIHGRPTWPTPSPACRRIRRPGPTCCSHRGWTIPPSSASSGGGGPARSACWPAPNAPERGRVGRAGREPDLGRRRLRRGGLRRPGQRGHGAASRAPTATGSSRRPAAGLSGPQVQLLSFNS